MKAWAVAWAWVSLRWRGFVIRASGGTLGTVRTVNVTVFMNGLNVSDATDRVAERAAGGDRVGGIEVQPMRSGGSTGRTAPDAPPLSHVVEHTIIGGA